MGNAFRARRPACLFGVACGARGAVAASGTPSWAQTAQNFGDQAAQSAPLRDPRHELETKYIVGFTQGSDIDAEGEPSIEFETTAGFPMRGGRCKRGRAGNRIRGRALADSSATRSAPM